MELIYYQWLLPALIERPGRINRYSRANDPILRFIDNLDLALTEEEVDRALAVIASALRSNFRVMPRQRLSKPCLARPRTVASAVVNAFQTPKRKPISQSVASAIPRLLKTKSLGAILYEKFRSGIVHGASVSINEREFFTKTRPYWDPEFSPDYGAYLVVEFPARFLLDVLLRCIHTYRLHLLQRRRVPPDIFYQIFDGPEFDFQVLDEEVLNQPKRLRLDIPER